MLESSMYLKKSDRKGDACSYAGRHADRPIQDLHVAVKRGTLLSSVDASQTFSQVIVVAVTIVAVVAVVAAPVSTLPATAVVSTAASVVFVFAPAPPRAMAIRRVALSFSFSVAVVQIHPLLTAPFSSKI